MTVKRVGIVGSGIMGSGIAEVAAKAGFEVSLRSRQQNTADRMMAGLEKSLGKQVDKGKLDAGVASRDDIDAAMKGGCNFPMGPLELLDLVGLDTSLAIVEALYAEFRDPNYAPAPLLRRMVSAERLGRKTGHGFYDYG